MHRMADKPDTGRDVRSTHLPGIGDRHEFTTSAGDSLGVVRHRGGDRELLVFSSRDPDDCRVALRLDGEEARRLAAMLGAGPSDRSD
jgi:TrkA domain protein